MLCPRWPRFPAGPAGPAPCPRWPCPIATKQPNDPGAVYLYKLCETVCAGSGVLIEGFGESNDFNATCGSDDLYWAAHGTSLFYQLADPVVQFELTATAPAGFAGNSLSVDIEASKENNNGNLNILAFLFNYATGSYESLPSIMPLTTTDVIQTFDLPAGARSQ